MSMAGYTKLFNSILASTIWREDDKTRIVWITLLAMADKTGMAEGSVPGIADFARVSVAACRRALEKLQEPDKESRTGDYDGRRIRAVDGGWLILNHGKYRAKLNQDERREYLRQKQAEYRRRKQASTNVNKVSDTSTVLTQAEAKAEAEADTKERSRDTSTAIAVAGHSARHLADAWNRITQRPIPKCRELTKQRQAAADRRLKERPISEWATVIERIQASDFCSGAGNTGWVATFDWLLKPDTATKVLEGKYDNRAGAKRGQSVTEHNLRGLREDFDER